MRFHSKERWSKLHPFATLLGSFRDVYRFVLKLCYPTSSNIFLANYQVPPTILLVITSYINLGFIYKYTTYRDPSVQKQPTNKPIHLISTILHSLSPRGNPKPVEFSSLVEALQKGGTELIQLRAIRTCRWIQTLQGVIVVLGSRPKKKTVVGRLMAYNHVTPPENEHGNPKTIWVVCKCFSFFLSGAFSPFQPLVFFRGEVYIGDFISLNWMSVTTKGSTHFGWLVRCLVVVLNYKNPELIAFGEYRLEDLLETVNRNQQMDHSLKWLDWRIERTGITYKVYIDCATLICWCIIGLDHHPTEKPPDLLQF